MATFRKFIFICTGSDCKKNGCKTLIKQTRELIKSEDHKGKFKLIKTKCMDFCKSGPLAVLHNQVIKRAQIEDLKKFF